MDAEGAEGRELAGNSNAVGDDRDVGGDAGRQGAGIDEGDFDRVGIGEEAVGGHATDGVGRAGGAAAVIHDGDEGIGRAEEDAVEIVLIRELRVGRDGRAGRIAHGGERRRQIAGRRIEIDGQGFGAGLKKQRQNHRRDGMAFFPVHWLTQLCPP